MNPRTISSAELFADADELVIVGDGERYLLTRNPGGMLELQLLDAFAEKSQTTGSATGHSPRNPLHQRD